MLLIFIGMAYEWNNITKSNFAIWIRGLILILPILSLCFIKYYFNNASFLILWYFIIIWSNDIMAMIGGKTIGGPKFAPLISPNKTWSGFFVGTISATCISIIFYKLLLYYSIVILNNVNDIQVTLISFFLACVAQFSDLSISMVKRKFNVKDSGNLIPGHGGFLDRFDSIIITAPLLLLTLYLIRYL
jgi:phosphatidate cytidylyltransferase